MLGLDLKDQGQRVARLLEARRRRRPDEALRQELVVQIPRRSTKTTSIMSTMLGRADTRPGHRVVITAQSGNIASQIMREHAQILLARGYAVESRSRRRRPGRIVYYANGGRERLEWPSTDRDGNPIDVSQEEFDDVTPEELEERGIRLGSKIWAVPPDAGAVRSQASDDIWIDEAGELDGNVGTDLLTGVLPLMDTRGPLAQLVVSGTPGKFRDGMFWELLSEGREGGSMAPGILDYSAAGGRRPRGPEGVAARAPRRVVRDGHHGDPGEAPLPARPGPLRPRVPVPVARRRVHRGDQHGRLARGRDRQRGAPGAVRPRVRRLAGRIHRRRRRGVARPRRHRTRRDPRLPRRRLLGARRRAPHRAQVPDPGPLRRHRREPRSCRRHRPPARRRGPGARVPQGRRGRRPAAHVQPG